MTQRESPVERQAGTANTPTTDTTGDMRSSASMQLARLDDMDDYEIADGEPDIRGWDIRSVDGRKIGEVDGLLVDTAAMKVRYVELKLEVELAIDDDHRHAILPIGSARLDDDKDEVVVNVRSDVLRTLPPYTRGELSRENEHSLMERLTKGSEITSITHYDEGGDFYEQPYFDDRSPFAGRRARSGRSNDDARHFRRS